MRHPLAVLLGSLVVVAVVGPPWAVAADAPKRALDPKAPSSTVFEGKSADGLVYLWRGPKKYDPEKGVGLTLILHGSNLTRGWGFANHGKDTFRPDDLVISPDGTTSNGKGGFNFLGEPKDAKRLHALLEEVKKVWKVRGTYIYGHSQGSFFALYYAGEYPKDVDGVVAHASGVWTWTKLGKHGHGQAIVLMHGTQDPVVPYPQSVGGLKAFRDADYPLVRLRALEGWNHWPAEHNAAGGTPNTSQQLAWVEGMTTEDPDRLAACLEVLTDVKDKSEHDWAALASLGKRAAEAPFATAATKSRGEKAIAAVEKLAERHAEALAAVKPGAEADGKAWMAHLPIFLRQFDGLPACEKLAGTWKDTCEEHRDKGVAHLKKYYQSKEKDPAAAFEEGVAAVREGFLWCEVQDYEFRAALVTWQKDAKKLKLSKKALKEFESVKQLEEAWKDGWKAYEDVCKTAEDV
jgi:predicted esterase